MIFGRNCYNWMFPKIGVPQNGWFMRENLIKTHDLGGTPVFGVPPNYQPTDFLSQHPSMPPVRFAQGLPRLPKDWTYRRSAPANFSNKKPVWPNGIPRIQSPSQMVSKGCIITSLARYLGSITILRR